ncbi:MAG TPA: radical SAM family heme chaperone HemW, partial [Hellea balneolensis]|nr:radical SAM family heme chaperone HemW [Hellea balneolensis]
MPRATAPMLLPNSLRPGLVMPDIASNSPPALGVYIHWPYCARICPYCDFNIYKNSPGHEDKLVAAIVESLKYWREISGPRPISSIHFGGGTPSLLSANNMATLVATTTELWPLASDLEVGLEANPKDVSRGNVRGWRAAGIERLSLGVQSFDDQVLNFLGRDHSANMARKATDMVCEIMPRTSLDLIYGWRGQSLEHWQGELEMAVEIGVGHVSTYQLTIEEKTAFAKAQGRGNIKTVDDDRSADLYELAVAYMTRSGFDYYEVSNAAKDRAHQSRHNLLYWQGGDYVGVGPGAHGRLTVGGARHALIAPLKPHDYGQISPAQKYDFSEATALSPQAWAQEYVLMGLRISQGVRVQKIQEICGQSLDQSTIDNFVKDGLLQQKTGR